MEKLSISIEQKAKAYDEVLKQIKECTPDENGFITIYPQEIFPELKESEDERIRKTLIDYFNICHGDYYGELKRKDILAWLENQGEQKPIDKIEPKFHKGDWVVWKDKCYKINYNGCGYELVDQDGLSTSLEYGTINENAHLWNIQDAKDGDVLHSPTHNLIWIYKDIQHYHACVNMNYVKENFSTDGFIVTPTDVCPATKDEQTILFARMKEAGYGWDSEKKVLKKIEKKSIDKVKPKFKVGDWITDGYLYNKITDVLEDRYIVDTKFAKRSSIPFKFENYYHLWTIQDAKDGDVLAYVTDEEDLWIMIYWSLYEPYEGHVHYHALLVNDNFSDKGTCCICINDLKPATKEQRDLLFQKMHEAGWEFDFDKKVLKKIEQEPTDNDIKEALRTEYEKGRADAIAEMQNLAWSEEDDLILETIIDHIIPDKPFVANGFTDEELVTWLKSLKGRVQPRRRHTIFDEII